MNRFLLLALIAGILSPPPASALFGNKHYQTKQEAIDACLKWVSDGGEYISYESLWGRKGDWEWRPRRFCLDTSPYKKYLKGRHVFVRRNGEYDAGMVQNVKDVVKFHWK